MAIGLAATVCACASLPKLNYQGDPPIDMTSPVAKDVIAAEKNPGPFPRFADIPKAPTDVRSAAQWNRDVTAMTADRQSLEREAAEVTAKPENTEAFARELRSQVVAPAADVPTAKTQAESAAYAKALRDRVKPPPKRH